MPSRIWTSTADFQLGSWTGVLTSGDELTMGLGAGSWGAGGAMSEARKSHSAFGLSTAGVSVGGDTSGWSNKTEEYDGTAWAGGGALSLARGENAAAGTLTSGLTFGGTNGSVIAGTEEYNGTTWGAGGNMALARRMIGGTGESETSAISMGGYSGAYKDECEEYNGTTWSSGGALNAKKYTMASAGILTSGLSMGGYSTGASVESEEYNGTTWSSGGNMNTSLFNHPGGCGADNDGGLIFGGRDPGYSVVTESYDGTAWAAEGNLTTGRDFTAGAGTNSAAICMGGRDVSAANIASTEEYTVALQTSGKWTVQLDSSTVGTIMGDIDLTTGAGDVQARIRTAVNQAGLGAASWVPASGYYTVFPATNTAGANQWAELEITMCSSATVQDVTLDYSFPSTGGGDYSVPWGFGFGLGLNL